MQKIPSQILLAVFVFSIVALSNLMSAGGNANWWDKNHQSTGEGYMAPVVSTANQANFLKLLQIDRKAAYQPVADSSPSCLYSVTSAKQSYNAIASQFAPSTLQKYNLPGSLN